MSHKKLARKLATIEGKPLLIAYDPGTAAPVPLAQTLADLEQRVKDMLEQDECTGEHKNATPLDYVRWAVWEIEENQK